MLFLYSCGHMKQLTGGTPYLFSKKCSDFSVSLLFQQMSQHYKVMAQVCAGIQHFMDHLDWHYSQNWEKMDFGRSKQQTGWYGSSKVSDAGWTLIPEGWNSMFS